jgi:ABC-type proline/glycine betaine transport system substrate-binding protein
MALLIILVIALFLASSIGAADRIRIAVSNPNMPNLTAAMAQKNGFFKEANLDAEIIRMNPNVAITALCHRRHRLLPTVWRSGGRRHRRSAGENRCWLSR